MNSEGIIAKYVWSADPETKKSTSAGAFFLIAKRFIELHKGQVAVYGCAFDKENTVRHIRIDSVENLPRLQGSKYVQSNTTGIYKEVLNDLKKGFYVLFSGTACQTVAAYKYAGDYAQKLYAIDVLCHGVPSPKLWELYIKSLERKYKGRIESVSFRNKSKTNRLGYILKLTVQGKEKKIFANESMYYSSFLNSYSLRPCCYNCPFVRDYNYTDLTLCDSNSKLFHSSKAISLLLIRNNKGISMFELISDKVDVKEANINDELCLNRKLYQSTICPRERESFYINNPIQIYDIIDSRKWIINRIKNIIPTFVKNIFKSR